MFPFIVQSGDTKCPAPSLIRITYHDQRNANRVSPWANLLQAWLSWPVAQPRRSGTKRATDHRQHMKKSPSITRAEDRRTFMQSGVEQPHKRHTRREGLFVGWASGMVGANDRPGETKWQCQEANTPGHGFSGQDLLQGGATKRGRERGRESTTISILTLMCLVLDGLAIVYSVANLKLLRK